MKADVTERRQRCHRALSTGTDSAGGYTVPTDLAAQLIDKMRAFSVLNNAGARTIRLETGETSIAKVASDPEPAWRPEHGLVAESEPTFARVQLFARALAVLVIVSREVLDDSRNIGTALPNIIAQRDEPLGVSNQGNIQELAHNGALTNYAPMLRARTMMLNANAGEPTAFVLSPREDGTLSELVDSTGQPLRMPPKLEGIQQVVSTQVPTNLGAGEDESMILAGDWSRLLLGMRTDLRIEILRERFSDRLEYGYLCWLRADVAVEHPESFVKITGITE
jgi:HK97 family phage major capsid protein